MARPTVRQGPYSNLEDERETLSSFLLKMRYCLCTVLYQRIWGEGFRVQGMWQRTLSSFLLKIRYCLSRSIASCRILFGIMRVRYNSHIRICSAMVGVPQRPLPPNTHTHREREQPSYTQITMFCTRISKSHNVFVPGYPNYTTFLYQDIQITQRVCTRISKLHNVFVPGYLENIPRSRV